jgi:ribonuclease BN (tRNA processing enzyme)
MSMTLTVVGCGDAFGSGGRLHTCFHLDAGSSRVFVDFGATSLYGLHRLGLDTRAVDAIVLSHLHGDHFGGLPFLLLHSQFVACRDRPLVIAGPPGVEARVRAAQEVMFPGSSRNELCFDLIFRELPVGGRTDVAGFRVETFEVSHPSGAPALALRLSGGGRTFAYSGDTEWTETLVEVARGADLFVCESYAFDKPIPYHVEYVDILAARGRLQSGRIMLTHLGPEALARRGEFEPSILVAEDGMVVEV